MKTKTRKLSLDDFFEEDFHLIAIYSEEEDYRMAFLLNYYFGWQLIKSTNLVEIKSDIEFPLFEYKDKTHFRDYYLLNNRQLKKHKQIDSGGLFAEVETIVEKTVNYLKEFPKAGFILKIEADEDEQFYYEFIDKLIKIPQIYTAELVDLQRIKNLDLLKF